METLDAYDPKALDDRQYDEMDTDARYQVEDELNRRDQREGRVFAELYEDDMDGTMYAGWLYDRL